MPEDIEESVLGAPEKVVDILRRLNMVASGGEARRLIEQGGVRANGEPVTDVHAMIDPVALPIVLQVGKRKFVRLVAG